MAYLEVSAFKKIRAFFWALKISGFNLNKIPFQDNEGTPVDKAYCFNLLRSFPDFQGQAFKDDNFLIKYLSKPGNLKQILDQFTPAQQIELTKVLEEKPIAAGVTGEQPGGEEISAEQGTPAQTPVVSTGGAMGVPGLPSTPSISSAGRRTRVIYNIPHTPEPPKPEIAIASKSGAVREAGDPSKLVKATRSGEIVEKGQPSELVTADKSGRIVKGPGAEAPTKQIFITDKGGVVTGMRNITSPGWLKNFGSAVQIGIKKVSTRLGSTISNFLRGAGRAGGGMLGGAIGGGGRALGRFGLRAVDVGANLSQQVSRGGLSLAEPKNKVLVWGLIGGFLLFFGINIIGGIIAPPTTPSSAAAPVVGGPSYTGGGGGIVSCPLNNGRVSCGSKLSSHTYCNHCGSGYEPYTCPADTGTGRDTAIDVVSSNKLVFLPYIEGASVQWTIDEAGTAIPTSEGGGIAISANTKVGEKSYGIRVVHITSTNLAAGHKVSSGTLIGQYGPATSHVHITLQENGEFKPADTYFKLCTK